MVTWAVLLPQESRSGLGPPSCLPSRVQQGGRWGWSLELSPCHRSSVCTGPCVPSPPQPVGSLLSLLPRAAFPAGLQIPSLQWVPLLAS